DVGLGNSGVIAGDLDLAAAHPAAHVASHPAEANESDVHDPPIFPLLPGCSRPTRKRSVLAGETDRHEQILEISIVIVGFEGILTGEQHRFRSVSERQTKEV